MKRNQGPSKVLTLCLVAMFAALICACTFISIPLPFGYFHLGDVGMLLGACILGLPAAISAAIGASLADVLMGYTIYAPATAIIKGLCVVTACAIMYLTKRFPDKKAVLLSRLAIAAIASEILMVTGYLAFEAFALSYGTAALASVLGNCMQGICGVIGSIAIYEALELSGAIKFIKKYVRKSEK